MALRRSAGPYIWATSLPQAPHRVNNQELHTRNRRLTRGISPVNQGHQSTLGRLIGDHCHTSE